MKTFEAKYIRGSLEDTFGSVATNNGTTKFAQTKKGYAVRLNGSSKWISYAGSRTVKSVVVWLYANSLSKDIIDFDGGTYSIEVGATNITATGFVSPSIYVDAVLSLVLDVARWRCVVITTTTGFTANALKIGKETTYFNGDIAMVKLYDNTLSQVDIDQEQAEFERAKIISRPNSGFVLSKPNDLSRYKGTGAGQGLVFASNMIPRGTTLTDISGNGNSPTLTGGNIAATKNGILFPNSGYYKKTGFAGLLTGLNANQYTVSMRVKFNELGREQHFCDMTGNGKYIGVANKIIMSDIAGHALTGNTAVPKNEWVTISFLVKAPGCEIFLNGVTDGSNTNYGENITALSLFIGYYYGETGNYKLNGEIADIRIHNRLLTASEIKAYHNSFILQTFNEDFSTYSIGTL